MEDNNILEYKNFYLFYKNLYGRLFDLMNLLIDENKYNINKIKNNLIDFLDSYCYYMLKQKLVTEDHKEKPQLELLKEFKEFENFYSELNSYPSQKYIKARKEFKAVGFDLNKLSPNDYELLIKEYYFFFEKALIIIKNFIDVSSTCGFLPHIKSKKALKSIGYQNYDLFFTNLENLKIKVSEITNNINLNNSFKSRRCMYVLIILFSPYFRHSEVTLKLQNDLNFSFLDNKENLVNIKRAGNYKSSLDIPLELRKEIEEGFLNSLKQNISFIKRFISYEFGELDMSPKIKKKYAYDPTGV